VDIPLNNNYYKLYYIDNGSDRDWIVDAIYIFSCSIVIFFILMSLIFLHQTSVIKKNMCVDYWYIYGENKGRNFHTLIEL
jgi:hypothetical protein